MMEEDIRKILKTGCYKYDRISTIDWSQSIIKGSRKQKITVIFKLKGYQKILEERRSWDDFFDFG